VVGDMVSTGREVTGVGVLPGVDGEQPQIKLRSRVPSLKDLGNLILRLLKALTMSCGLTDELTSSERREGKGYCGQRVEVCAFSLHTEKNLK